MGASQGLGYSHKIFNAYIPLGVHSILGRTWRVGRRVFSFFAAIVGGSNLQTTRRACLSQGPTFCGSSRVLSITALSLFSSHTHPLLVLGFLDLVARRTLCLNRRGSVQLGGPTVFVQFLVHYRIFIHRNGQWSIKRC